jgi:phospholipid/cholesterol/gamma-HCH transport system permease protein
MAAGTLLAQANRDGISLLASGTWTAEYARTLEPLVDAVTDAKAPPRTLAIDVAKIDRIDTYGAWLIERTLRAWRSRGVDAQLYGLPERHRGLFEKVQAGTHELSSLPPKPNSILATLESVGRTMAVVLDDVLLLSQMGGALVLAFLRVLLRPHTFRFTSLAKHLERVAWNAVPIILMITLLIGAIIAQQGIFHFRTFGADLYVVDMVGVLVLRELGVVIVCIMVAGRSGSAYTAELGSMKMREEIDALRTMGFDPVEVLILPRILALIIAVPLLAFIGSMAALYGGGLVAWLYGGISPTIFMARLRDAISLQTFEVGMIKAPFMALIIGLIACVEGLRVSGSAESLGSKTTESVVKSIFLVIVVDGAFAVFFASIGI